MGQLDGVINSRENSRLISEFFFTRSREFYFKFHPLLRDIFLRINYSPDAYLAPGRETYVVLSYGVYRFILQDSMYFFTFPVKNFPQISPPSERYAETPFIFAELACEMQ